MYYLGYQYRQLPGFYKEYLTEGEQLKELAILHFIGRKEGLLQLEVEIEKDEVFGLPLGNELAWLIDT